MSQLNIRKLSRELHIPQDKDDIFFRAVFAVSNLSTGVYRKQGAILALKDRGVIISSGFFDAYIDPAKTKTDEDKEFGSGAIENCIAECARRGISSEGTSLYVYTLPNIIQCKLLVRAGIKEIHCLKDVTTSDAHKICMENNVKVFIHAMKT